jgi:hypothetical protein
MGCGCGGGGDAKSKRRKIAKSLRRKKSREAAQQPVEPELTWTQVSDSDLTNNEQ